VSGARFYVAAFVLLVVTIALVGMQWPLAASRERLRQTSARLAYACGQAHARGMVMDSETAAQCAAVYSPPTPSTEAR